MGGSDDRREVLDFHGDRSGALAPNEARRILDQGADLGADRRRVERGRDAETREDLRRELAVGHVDAGGDEDMIARVEECEVDQGDRGLAARAEDRVRAALELGDARGELEGGRCAVETIGVADAMLVPAVVDGGG